MFAIEKNWTMEEEREIDTFLSRAYALLSTGDYQIAPTEKNKQFDRKYPLTDSEKRMILKSLTKADCIAVEPNNKRYEDGLVFKFVKDVLVDVYGEEEVVTVYFKQYIHEGGKFELVIVISFHEEGMHDTNG